MVSIYYIKAFLAQKSHLLKCWQWARAHFHDANMQIDTVHRHEPETLLVFTGNSITMLMHLGYLETPRASSAILFGLLLTLGYFECL